MNNDQEYKYYKIIRLSDNKTTSICTVFNFIKEHFTRLHGFPSVWSESNEKYEYKVKKDVIQVPIRIIVIVDDEEYLIKLSKQEYRYIPLKVL